MKPSLAIVIVIAIGFAGPLRPASAGAGIQQALEAPGELSQREAAVHVLDRLGYGPRPGDIQRVLEMGIENYIEAQLHPEALLEDAQLERRLAGLTTLTTATSRLFRDYPPPARLRAEMRRRGEEPDSATLQTAARRSFIPLRELSQARLARAVYSERQLQEVMVDFWLNHFNVYARKGPLRLFLTDYEREAIRPHALGRFRDLLGAVARSPAMLIYLDNWMSVAPEDSPRAGPAPRGRAGRRQGDPLRAARGLNENYARELLELHTIGVQAGYTQEDVVNVARALTGWTVNLRTGEFAFRPHLHDAADKFLLGQKLDESGMEDGEQVLDILAAHPSTARFITEKLARRFVSDQPPAALVERATTVFEETEGDIREVVRSIVTSPEFFSRQAYRAKVKTPLEWLASGMRGMGIDLRELGRLVAALNRLDQPLYGAESPAGYPDVAEAWASSGALLARAELAERLGAAGIRGLSNREPGANSAIDSALDRLLPGVDRERLRRIIGASVPGDASPRRQLQAALALTLASPEFQRR